MLPKPCAKSEANLADWHEGSLLCLDHSNIFLKSPKTSILYFELVRYTGSQCKHPRAVVVNLIQIFQLCCLLKRIHSSMRDQVIRGFGRLYQDLKVSSSLCLHFLSQPVKTQDFGGLLSCSLTQECWLLQLTQRAQRGLNSRQSIYMMVQSFLALVDNRPRQTNLSKLSSRPLSKA